MPFTENIGNIYEGSITFALTTLKASNINKGDLLVSTPSELTDDVLFATVTVTFTA